jgi:hypothetical protein
MTQLKVMRDPDDLAKVRQFIHHPDWRVRVHAGGHRRSKRPQYTASASF